MELKFCMPGYVAGCNPAVSSSDQQLEIYWNWNFPRPFKSPKMGVNMLINTFINTAVVVDR